MFLVACIALSHAVVFAKGNSKELFDKFCGHTLILKGGQSAINPVTALPYVFVFVDNSNSKPGDGTFNNPYSTLAAAQAGSAPNDIIYVFPGNGTDFGYNTGFNLQAGQQFLGAGIKQSLLTATGCVKIPAQVKGLPVLSNSDFTATAPAHAALTATAGGNVISGISFVDDFGGVSGLNDSSCIRIENGLNYVIKKNVLSTVDITGGGKGLNIFGGGNMKVKKNTFICRNAGDCYGIYMFAFVAPFEGTFVFEKNLFTGANASSGLDQGLHIETGNGQGVTGAIALYILCNTSNSQTNTADDAPAGITLACYDIPTTTPVTALIKGNHVTIPATINCSSAILPSNCAGISVASFGPGVLLASLFNNVAITADGTPGYLLQNETANTATANFVLQPELNHNVGTIVIL